MLASNHGPFNLSAELALLGSTREDHQDISTLRLTPKEMERAIQALEDRLPEKHSLIADEFDGIRNYSRLSICSNFLDVLIN
jgi:hypothetical protein